MLPLLGDSARFSLLQSPDLLDVTAVAPPPPVPSYHRTLRVGVEHVVGHIADITSTLCAVLERMDDDADFKYNSYVDV